MRMCCAISCFSIISLLIGSTGCKARGHRINNLPNKKMVSIQVIPEEGKSLSRSYRVEKVSLGFVLRVGHKDGRLLVGYDCANPTLIQYRFKYVATFYNSDKNLVAKVECEAESPGPGMGISRPGAAEVACTAEEVASIAYILIEYDEFPTQAQESE